MEELKTKSWRNQKLAWGIMAGAFFLMAVWPLWSAHFPPMQDYPRHLFQVQVLRDYNDSAFDYRQNFEIHLQPTYASFYLITVFLSRFFPIETAGKLSLSLYPVLIAVIVWRLGRRPGREVPPWGALLFFPLAFNQQYFLGTVNYCLALPILILALLDLEDLLGGTLGAWLIARHSLWQVALFITHPFAFDVYVSLAVVAAFMNRRRAREFIIKVMAVFGVATLLLVSSWIKSKATPSPELPAALRINWLSPRGMVEFFALMFTGMQDLDSADWVALVLWGGVFAVVLGAWITDWKKRGPLPLLYVIFLLSTILGFIILPFRIGTYTFINLRTAAIIYFLIALLVAQMRFRGWWRYSLVGFASLCMIHSVVKQARISAEINEIVPIISAIPSNACILPLVFDPGSPELDRHWFDIHLHEHSYYNILVGSGYNSYMFPAPVNPVHYRSGRERPAPGEYNANRFSWKKYSADYQYFLIRGMPNGLNEYMLNTCNKVCVSGEWTLFKRKPQ